MLSRLSKLHIVNFSYKKKKKKKHNTGVNGKKENLASSLTSRNKKGVERFPPVQDHQQHMFNLFFLVSWGV